MSLPPNQAAASLTFSPSLILPPSVSHPTGASSVLLRCPSLRHTTAPPTFISNFFSCPSPFFFRTHHSAPPSNTAATLTASPSTSPPSPPSTPPTPTASPSSSTALNRSRSQPPPKTTFIFPSSRSASHQTHLPFLHFLRLAPCNSTFFSTINTALFFHIPTPQPPFFTTITAPVSPPSTATTFHKTKC